MTKRIGVVVLLVTFSTFTPALTRHTSAEGLTAVASVVTASPFDAVPESALSRATPLRVKKSVCGAHSITIRESPGGRVKGGMRRGDIFVVTDKRDGVWFYGYSERGQEGYVLARYLCSLP
jgi:hypothetical protein